MDNLSVRVKSALWIAKKEKRKAKKESHKRGEKRRSNEPPETCRKMHNGGAESKVFKQTTLMANTKKEDRNICPKTQDIENAGANGDAGWVYDGDLFGQTRKKKTIELLKLLLESALWREVDSAQDKFIVSWTDVLSPLKCGGIVFLQH